MPKNKWMYLGVLIIVASALLWIGAKITQTIEWMLPYSGVLGLVLIVIGVFLEARKKTDRLASSPSSSSTSDASYTAASGTEAKKSE